MAGTSVISGGVSNFGSLASIRKQADSLRQRVEAESAARKAEQEKTGLIKNPKTGEMVELSSISEETRERWEHHEAIMSVSPQEALIAALASAPNSDDVEAAQALGAKYAKIQDKMLAGKKLTGQEKRFLQEHYPEVAAQAARVEQEVAQLKKKLQGSKSKEEARQIYMDAKTRLMGGANKSDGTILLMIPAMDEVYSQHMKGGSTSKLDIWA